MNLPQHKQFGITLVEMIVVIVIMGIIGGIVALFLRRPVQQYQDLTIRAELTDTADTAVRRMSREIHLAVPNSMRSANSSCIEFVPAYDGGRYRVNTDATGAGNAFTTVQAISTFDVIGNLNAAPAVGDFVVVYNLGIPGADIYAAADNKTNIVAPTSVSQLNFASKLFPFASPGNKFQLVSGTERAVSFVCNGVGVDAKGNGTGKLYRASGYGFVSPEPTTCASVSTAPVLAQNISSCQFSYAQGVLERFGLVSIKIRIAKAGETISLYQDVQVNNVP